MDSDSDQIKKGKALSALSFAIIVFILAGFYF